MELLTIAQSVENNNKELSNFWSCDVEFDGVIYPSTEHAYQAAKTLDPLWREQIRNCDTFGKSKRMGNKAPLREDWEQIKLSVMEHVLRQKFAAGSELAEKLMETKGKKLAEGNTWNDVFWGVCNGKGENHLGRLLMKIREDLLKEV